MALIYIVEDDESIREIETIALKNSNYIVSAFENAKEFYKKLDELVPDLILGGSNYSSYFCHRL